MAYIEKLPPPLLDDILNDRCLPFIGAGFSAYAAVPSPPALPDWEKLGRHFAAQMLDYEYGGPLDAISAFEHAHNRSRLIEELRKQLRIDDVGPGMLHAAFARLFFSKVVTTNFDDVLEKSFQAAPVLYRAMIGEQNLAVASASAAVELIKFHGDLTQPSTLVATEDDYDNFLFRFPLLATYLTNLLIRNSALFLGYSVSDPDVRQLLGVIAERLGPLQRRPYTILVGASQTTIDRFRRRRINVINYDEPKEKYAQVMTSLFNELRERWARQTKETIVPAEEEALAEIRIADEVAGSRLCFIAVPAQRASFYRSNVYPIVEAYGFVPVSSFDVISSPTGERAATSSLLERTAVMITEVRSGEDYYSYQLIRLGYPRKPTIVVAMPALILQQSEPVAAVIDIDQSDEDLLQNLTRAIADLSPSTFGSQASIGALLERSEYAAAILAAASSIEVSLRKAAERANISARTFTQLIRSAVAAKLIDQSMAQQIDTMYRQRSMIIHGTEPTASRNQAFIAAELASRMREIAADHRNTIA